MGLFGLFGGKKSTEPVIPQRERIQAQPEKPKQQSTSPVQKASQESENIRRLVEAKATITEEIRANLAGCKGVFTAYYSGVTVAQDTDIRRIAKKTDCIFKVYKNLDFTKAVQGTEYEEAGNRQGPHVYGFLQSMDTINQIGLYAKNHEIDFAVNYLKIDGKKIDYDSYIMGVMDNIAAEKKAIAGTVSPNGRVDIEDVYFSFKSAGWDKINVIKVVRDIAGLGLKEAKEIVEGFGSTRMALGIGRNVFKKAVERIGSFGAVMQFSVKDGPREDLDDLDDFLRRVYFAGETAGMAEAESKSEVKVASASDGNGPFALYIVHTGVQKVAVIKEIRDITGWGLKESKQYADTCDYERIELMEFDSKLAAQKAARQLSEVGAEVEISVK